MSKATKIWIIIAFILILIGGILFVGIMMHLNWDFNKISTDDYETNTHAIDEEFENILIETNTADIEFIKDSDAKVTCFEAKNENHTVIVENQTLKIKIENKKKWYEYISLNFRSPKITLSIPEGEYIDLAIQSDTGNTIIPNYFYFKNIEIEKSTGSVDCKASAESLAKIKTSTGSISIENASIGALDLSTSTGNISVKNTNCNTVLKADVSTGKIELDHIQCSTLSSDGSTGDIKIKNVVASGNFAIRRDTGDIYFDHADAGEINIETDTGDIGGTLLSEKIFIVETDTGKIDVPKSTIGGECQITTDTGDITLSIVQKK